MFHGKPMMLSVIFCKLRGVLQIIPPFLFYCSDTAAACGSVHTPPPAPPSAAVIWWTTLHMWLLMAETLERLSFAVGMLLAKTWRPTVRRQPEVGPLPSFEGDKLSRWLLVLLSLVGPVGSKMKPMGRRGM